MGMNNAAKEKESLMFLMELADKYMCEGNVSEYESEQPASKLADKYESNYVQKEPPAAEGGLSKATDDIEFMFQLIEAYF